MNSEVWLKRIEAALKLDWPYQGRDKRIRAMPKARPQSIASAVLATIGFTKTGTQPGPHLLLTLRSQEVESHRGQISFPGGVLDPGETHEAGALREAEEELGLRADQIRLLGRLPQLTIPTSGFHVTPLVGHLLSNFEEIELQPHRAEVEEAFWVPLEELLRPEIAQTELYRIGEVDYPMPVFYWGPHRIWGATAAMIRNLLDRLDQVQGE